MFQRGDIVRRKNDLCDDPTSPRTRVVADVQTDANGVQHVTLDAFLDGWLIWDARRLESVKPHKTAPRPRHETKI